MRDFTTVKLEIEEDIATIWLDKSDIFNAYSEMMFSELLDAFKSVGKMSEIRVVLFKGKGKSFCVGPDQNWLKDIVKCSYEQNYQESLLFGKCLYEIYTCKKPTIAIVHGAAIDGGIGMFAACDFAFCDDETIFSITDVKNGVVQACITPYLIKRVGEFATRELMLTGKKIKGFEAENYRLVNKTLAKNLLDDYVAETIEHLRSAGPSALSYTKNLIYDIANTQSLDESLEYTSKIIADIRATDEGQEGVNAFLKKRKPYWIRK